MGCCFLLADGDASVMIDTGLVGETILIRRLVRKLGLAPQSIKAILLTHGHLDHAGNLAKLKEWTGARIYAHPDEQAHVDGTYPYQGINRWCGRLEAAGRQAVQIDFHSLTKPGHVGWRQKVHPYAIPLQTMIPKGLKNLLVAGKPISGDQIAMSSYRMTPTVCAMGQAAGTAAALAIETGKQDIREVDVAALRAQLATDGMELDPRKHKPFAPEVTPTPEDAK